MATTSVINKPPTDEFLDARTIRNGNPAFEQFSFVRPTQGWQTFFSQVWQICLAITLSGTTANRPTKLLWVGRTYFDTSLGANGKPIWISAVSASGVATWVDSASNVV